MSARNFPWGEKIVVLRFDRVAFGLPALVSVMSSAQQQARADEPVVLTEQEILAQIVGNTALDRGPGSGVA